MQRAAFSFFFPHPLGSLNAPYCICAAARVKPISNYNIPYFIYLHSTETTAVAWSCPAMLETVQTYVLLWLRVAAAMVSLEPLTETPSGRRWLPSPSNHTVCVHMCVQVSSRAACSTANAVLVVIIPYSGYFSGVKIFVSSEFLASSWKTFRGHGILNHVHPSTMQYCFVGKNFMVRLSTMKTTKILPPEKIPAIQYLQGFKGQNVYFAQETKHLYMYMWGNHLALRTVCGSCGSWFIRLVSIEYTEWHTTDLLLRFPCTPWVLEVCVREAIRKGYNIC